MRVHGSDVGPGSRGDVKNLDDVKGAQTVTTTHDVDSMTDDCDGELKPSSRQTGHRRPAI